MFFNNLDKFSENVAVYETKTKLSFTYKDLDKLAKKRLEELGDARQLIFIEAANNIKTIINYVACLQGKHVVFLTDNIDDANTIKLIEHYKPNIIIGSDDKIQHLNTAPINLHPDLALLLSTSGSTGTPKFVKLSALNIQSNARSIADYLELKEDDRAMAHLKLHYSYAYLY